MIARVRCAPLVHVVKRTIQGRPHGQGKVWVEDLTCGHQWIGNPTPYKGAGPMRRRCYRCYNSAYSR